MSSLDIIALDADDTLWHHERLYTDAQTQLMELLTQFHSPEWISERLYQAELRNLQHFGYGVKGFALSMIETAIELTEGRISGREIQLLIDSARQILSADVELIDHVAETIKKLEQTHTLMVITKGDLRDQELKIARSGLAHHFRYVEVVSDKTPESYARVLQRYNIAPERFMMVGNSLRSDVLPVLMLGARAVYVPYPLTWVHERAEPPTDNPRYHEIANIGLLPDLLAELG